MNTDLLNVPNVGKKTLVSLMNMGITRVEDLVGKVPEELYHLDCIKKRRKEDMCQLYLFRALVYYAENESHDPEKLKWWYWKDKKYINK